MVGFWTVQNYINHFKANIYDKFFFLDFIQFSSFGNYTIKNTQIIQNGTKVTAIQLNRRRT